MTISTYANLQTAVASWMHRADQTALIPDYIALGEAHLNRVIRVPEMQETTTLAITSASRFASLPARFLGAVSLSYDGCALRQMTTEAVTLAAGVAAAGRPEMFAVTHRFEFERVPDAAYTLDLVFVEALDLATDSTNWLLARHPDAYLFAALVEGATAIGIADNRLGAWAARRDAAIAAANAAETGRFVTRLRCDELAGLSAVGRGGQWPTSS